MSAQEFGQWQVFFRNEQEHPQALRMQHAVLVAALRNGPLTKNDRTLWTAAECLPADAWQPQQKADTPPPTAAELAAQVERINALY